MTYCLNMFEQSQGVAGECHVEGLVLSSPRMTLEGQNVRNPGGVEMCWKDPPCVIQTYPISKLTGSWIIAPGFVKLQAFERWCKVFEPQLYGGFCSNLIAWHCFTSKCCTISLFQEHQCCHCRHCFVSIHGRRTSLSVSSASILRASRLQPRSLSINMVVCQCVPFRFVPYHGSIWLYSATLLRRPTFKVGQWWLSLSELRLEESWTQSRIYEEVLFGSTWHILSLLFGHHTDIYGPYTYCCLPHPTRPWCSCSGRLSQAALHQRHLGISQCSEDLSFLRLMIRIDLYSL